MYVLSTLVLAPLGLLAVMAMSWMEDRLLPPRGTGLAVPAPGETDVRTRQPPERNH